mgnify:CR=1 FL=1
MTEMTLYLRSNLNLLDGLGIRTMMWESINLLPPVFSNIGSFQSSSHRKVVSVEKRGIIKL